MSVHMGSRGRWGTALLTGLLMTCLGATTPTETKTEGGTETRPPHVVKADFLLRFLDYIESPALAQTAPDEAVVMVIGGSDDVLQALQRAAQGRRVGTHPVVCRPVAEGETLERVHLLYLGPGTDLLQHPLVKLAQSLPVVLVTDAPRGDPVGVINFIWTQDRVRFDVSLEAAERVGLKVSSRILQVAHRVVVGSR
ncbi:DUF4154 domain-containing protein [Aquabacterium fontiphilum]|uniref:YfiR family protein n=1 Tax=Aquabacterium fontiphilum TaxID=450365 RepID=UPI00137801CF|nr:YfiR family protein [Aquabacterium fontiphilum]NBD22145.1 DUF4154 domain-containing protein [Aquabacterium fontiphilum]